MQNEVFENDILPSEADQFSSTQAGESIQFDHGPEWI